MVEEKEAWKRAVEGVLVIAARVEETDVGLSLNKPVVAPLVVNHPRSMMYQCLSVGRQVAVLVWDRLEVRSW